jgi:minor curlin subunit
MKTIFFLLVGSVGIIPLAHAQVNSSSNSVSQAASAEQRLAEDLGVDRLRNALLPPDTRNAAALLQVGNSNKANIDQASQATLINQATVVQLGNSNVLGLTQTGAGNRTDFSQTGDANQAALRQNGTANTIVGQVTGNNTNVDVDQAGIGNQYSTQLTGNQGRYVIDQVGNNNSFTQRETSTSTPLPGYEVKMEGNNMHLTIEQGKVFP